MEDTYRCNLCGLVSTLNNFHSFQNGNDLVIYCTTDGCDGTTANIEKYESGQVEVDETKAQRIREDVLAFIEMMRFKHNITYHLVQVGYREGDGSKMTGLIDGSNSFLNAAKHQIDMIIEERQ